MLISLKQRVAPTDDARKLQFATQYAKLKMGPQSQNIEIWLQQWERIYTECRVLELPEVDGDRSVKDFIFAVQSTTPSWSDYWKNEMQRLKWRKEALPTFFDLVEIYRNHYRTNKAQDEQGRVLQSAYTVSFQGEKLSQEPSKEGRREFSPCVCGKQHPYRICYYLNELIRPKDWKPDEATQQAVERELASCSPSKKAIIERAQKSALQDQEKEPQKAPHKEPQKEPPKDFERKPPDIF